MPFKYPDPALVKLQVLDAPAPTKDKILGVNVIKLLGLETHVTWAG